MNRCQSCGEPLQHGDRDYHAACLQVLFGTDSLPAIDMDLARLHTLALAMVGKVSLSGVQRKLSVRLDDKRATLQLALGDSRYILKPQAGTFPELPQNEWLTQRLAPLVDIEVPPSALIELADGSVAYIVKRFDRRDDGNKRAMEDFCQLSLLPPAGKYDGSAERCAKIVRRHASEPLIEVLRLFRQFVFAWWVGNGDMHLKNLALLRADDGRQVLSPAYDQLCTRLVIPGDTQALTVCGKQDNIGRGTWRECAERFGIGPKAAIAVLESIAAALPEALERVTAAPLPESMRDTYAELLRARTASLER
jgi:serine/threonine-protein kinase HipA